MPYSSEAGLQVNNFYGARETGGSVGVERTQDSIHRLSINLTGAMLNGSFIPPVVVPKGARFVSAVLRVDEAFDITGTTPTVQIGAVGSVATNGIVLTEAEMEAIGTKVPASTGAGTWAQNSATGTTAASKISYALGGTTPAVNPLLGKATLILSFVNKTKV